MIFLINYRIIFKVRLKIKLTTDRIDKNKSIEINGGNQHIYSKKEENKVEGLEIKKVQLRLHEDFGIGKERKFVKTPVFIEHTLTFEKGAKYKKVFVEMEM